MTAPALIAEIASTLVWGWVGFQLAELAGLVVRGWRTRFAN